MHMEKNFHYLLMSLLIIVFSACSLDNNSKEENKEPAVLKTSPVYSVRVAFNDASGTAKINSEIKIIFSGVEVEDENKNTLSELTFSDSEEKVKVLYLKNIPTKMETLKLVTKADGYIDSGSSVVITENKNVYDINLNLVQDIDGVIARGIFASSISMKNKVDINGEVNETIVLENKEGSKEAGTKMVIPVGTTFTDREGQPIKGVKFKITNFNPQENEAIDAYPGGLNVIADASDFIIDGEVQTGEREIVFKSAGFAAISITDEEGNKVKNFSQDIEIAMQFKIGTTDGDGKIVDINDSVPIWSYDEDLGKWSYEKEGNVVDLNKSDGLYDVVYKLNHLSYWNLDWHQSAVCAPRFNIVDDEGNPDFRDYVFQMQMSTDPAYNSWIHNYQKDGFYIVNNVAAGYSGRFAIYSKDKKYLIGAVSFSDACLGESGKVFDVVTQNAGEIDAGADIIATYGDPNFTRFPIVLYGQTTDTYTSSDTHVAKVNANTGEVNILNAGTTVITIHNSGNDTRGPATDSYILIVNKAQQSINAGTDMVVEFDGNKSYVNALLYDGVGMLEYVSQNASGYSGSGEITYGSTNPDVGSIALPISSKVKLNDAGVAAIFVTIAEDENYLEASDSYILTITEKAELLTQVISIGEDVNTSYNSVPFIRTPTNIIGSGMVSYSSTNTKVATVNSSGEVRIVGAGVSNIVVNIEADTIYNSAGDSFLLRVSKAVPEFYFTEKQIKTFGSDSFIPALKSNSDAQLSYVSSNAGIASISKESGLVNINGIGRTIFTFSVAQSDNYFANSIEVEFEVIRGERVIDIGKDRYENYNNISYEQDYLITPITFNRVFTSSNNTIATIDAYGKVSLSGEIGETIITLSVPQDSFYNKATASYLLHVANYMSVQVGVKAVLLEWQELTNASSYTLYVSTQSFSNAASLSSYNTLENFQKIENILSSSYRVENLNNNIKYYFVLSATIAGEEVLQGDEVSATPKDAVHGLYYFSGSDDGFSFEPYISDGTTLGTKMLKDISPNGGSSVNPSTEYINYNGYTYFIALRNLWRSDSTELGTEQLLDNNYSYVTELKHLGEKLYFESQIASKGGAKSFLIDSNDKVEIFESRIGDNRADFGNATVYSSYLNSAGGSVGYYSDGNSTTALLDVVNPYKLTSVGNKIFYFKPLAVGLVKLFSADLNGSNVTSLASLSAIHSSYNIETDREAQILSFNNKLYFNASDGVNGHTLWVSDGTPQGTKMLLDLDGSSADSEVVGLKSIGDKFIFQVRNSQLWISDGSVLGTQKISDVTPTLEEFQCGTVPIVMQGKYYYTATQDGDTELWMSDGSIDGTLRIKNISVDGSSCPHNLIKKEGLFYFNADETGSKYEFKLWKSDGTPEGTMKLIDLMIAETGA